MTINRAAIKPIAINKYINWWVKERKNSGQIYIFFL
jgi:hypothetical protein